MSECCVALSALGGGGGADQHHVESDGVPSSALHVSLQMDTAHT